MTKNDEGRPASGPRHNEHPAETVAAVTAVSLGRAHHTLQPFAFTLLRGDESEAPSTFWAPDRDTARRCAPTLLRGEFGDLGE